MNLKDFKECQIQLIRGMRMNLFSLIKEFHSISKIIRIKAKLQFRFKIYLVIQKIEHKLTALFFQGKIFSKISEGIKIQNDGFFYSND